MRRSVTAALIAVAATVIPVAAAFAGPGSAITVVSRSGLPSPLLQLVGGSSCGTAEGAPTFAHVAGPTGAPLGHGSLAVTVPAHGYVGITDSFAAGTVASDLTLLSFSIYQPPAPTIPNNYLGLGLTLLTTPDNNGLYFVVQLGLYASGTAAWHATNIFDSSVSITWTKYKQVSGSTTEISHDTQPWTTFASNNPSAALSSLTIAALPDCGRPATTFNIDDLVIGTDAGSNDMATTYDFEPLIATTLKGTVSTTRSGHVVAPSVTVRVPGGSASGLPLTLWAKSATSTSYSQVDTATTNASGVAKAKPLHVSVDTGFQWRYAGSSDNAAATAKAVTVKVASSVSLKARATTIEHHGALHATGRVTHAHEGSRVTLWRVKGHHRIALAHVRERASGAYTITKRLPAGHYKVFTTVAASRYNAAGASARRSVSVF